MFMDNLVACMFASLLYSYIYVYIKRLISSIMGELIPFDVGTLDIALF